MTDSLVTSVEGNGPLNWRCEWIRRRKPGYPEFTGTVEVSARTRDMAMEIAKGKVAGLHHFAHFEVEIISVEQI